MKPVRVLVVGQTPPPHHGQAAMIKVLVDGTYQHIKIIHVRMNFSPNVDSSGKFKIMKLWELLRVVGAIYGTKLRHWPTVLYYPPATQGRLPVARDVFVLGMTRWLFGATVFHFHASGIRENIASLPSGLGKLFQLAAAKPDLAIRLCESAPRDGEALHAKREVVIPNGIPDAAGAAIVRDRLPGRRIHILFVGVLCEGKGVLQAIQAVQALVRQGMDVQLTCLGKWESAEFETRARSLLDEDLKDRIQFPGVIAGDEKWQMFRQADIFLFPTHYHSETHPVVLLEAMCFSLPIVSTRWRGIPDVVEDGSSAFLCDGFDVESCTEALAKLVCDADLRVKMGVSGRERFLANFTVSAHRHAMEMALASVREKSQRAVEAGGEQRESKKFERSIRSSQ